VSEFDHQIEQLRSQIASMNYLLSKWQKAGSFMISAANGSPQQFWKDEVGSGVIAGINARIQKLQKSWVQPARFPSSGSETS
jgi:hypothetical protein